MDRKKIIIVGIIVVIVIIIAVAVFMLVSKKSQMTQTQPAPSPVAVQLPADPNASVATSSGDVEGTKDAFEKYVAAVPQTPLGEAGYKKTQIRDKNNQPVSLDTFSQSTGITIYPKIKNLLKSDDFYPVNCGKGTSGLIVNAKLFNSYPNLYQDELAWMKEWEKDMLKDLHPVIFPDVSFSEEDLGQKVEFKDGKYRYAEVALPDGTKGSINYNIVFDSIIITNSLNCLDKISNDYLSLEP